MKIDFGKLVILFYILLSIVLFFPLQIQTDTISFTNAIDILLQQEGVEEDRLMRLSKPLSLFFPACLVMLGISAIWAMIIQQYIALFLSLVFIYILYVQYYAFEKSLVYKVLLLYLSSSVIMVYAYAALNDMLAWAFTWFLICYFHNIEKREGEATIVPFSKYILWGILSALGVFLKESVLVAGVYVFLAVLLYKNKSFLEKIKIYLCIGIPFFIMLIAGLFLTKILWGNNILDWLAFNHDDEENLYAGQWLKVYLVHFIRMFDVAWSLLLLGIFLGKGVRHLKLLHLIGAIILFMIYPLVWAYMLERIMFMFAPFYLYLLALGLQYCQHKNPLLANMVLLIILVANMLATYGAYIGLWSGILWKVYAISLLLFLLIKIGITYKVIPMRIH